MFSHVGDIDQAMHIPDLNKRYRIKGMYVRYQSDVRGAQLQLNDVYETCVRLGCSPIAYAEEVTDSADSNFLRIKGFYGEFVVHRDLSVNRKPLVVNGQSANSRCNPWLADPSIYHYGLFFKYCNLSEEYQRKFQRFGNCI
ncbi:hypothetical protein P879_09906 [Paragonimus westermani]|uniref:Uncharacterized protein n=1 Tax=Paragonimus westermani TaxID=34504 RepID=A0A8T0D5F5_9TREM|nr:hypothetical protein P879_09906 [Paragonimus westermani]